jgi:hypothetical protein
MEPLQCHIRRALVAAVAVSSLLGPPLVSAVSSSPPTVVTPCGTISGYWDVLSDGSRVGVFLGIRYGASPAGAARWTPSVAAGCWPGGGVLNATQFGAYCMQPGIGGAEDCLFLNAWVPEAALSNALSLPVSEGAEGRACHSPFSVASAYVLRAH